MLESAYKSVVPRVLLSSVAGWISQLPRDRAVAHPALAPSRPWSEVASGNGVTVREQTVVVASTEALSAVVVEPLPQAGDAPRSAVLILNTAGERRIGPSRMWVPFARERAAAGQIVMRLDQAGVGDSDFPAHRAAVNPYNDEVLADVAAAIEWLRANRGVTQCSVLGLCSGSYHALKAALAGLPGIHQVLAVNPSLFYWHDGMPLEEPTANPGNQVTYMNNAVRGIRDPQKWLRLLKGQIDLAGLLRAVLARTGRGLKFRLRDVARASGLGMQHDLAADLRAIGKRGIAVQFVFSAGDPGLKLLKEEAGGAWRQLVANRTISLDEVAEADHSFMSPASRRRLYAQLNRLLDAPASGGVATSASSAARHVGAIGALVEHNDDLVKLI
jgi:hypothetical protein